MNLSTGLEPLSSYDKLLLPDYSQKCIVHIPGYIKYLHGIEQQSVLANSSSPLATKKTVLFTVDGFGYKQWHEHQSISAVLTKFVDTCVPMIPR